MGRDLMQPAAIRVTEMEEISDTTLVRRARAGDAAAFEQMAASRLPTAFRLASAILGSEADAADATQNAFLAAWRELPRLRELDHFDAWLHRILVNECRMQVRRRARVREIPMNPESRPGAGYPAYSRPTLDRIELLDLLEGAFEQLDADDRAMVVMHHLEDRPLAEIAAALHMPVGTVKWRLHNARQVLQRALETVG
jgi:RNA polymerase sigma-70 factor, ECF subfamily